MRGKYVNTKNYGPQMLPSMFSRFFFVCFFVADMLRIFPDRNLWFCAVREWREQSVVKIAGNVYFDLLRGGARRKLAFKVEANAGGSEDKKALHEIAR